MRPRATARRRRRPRPRRSRSTLRPKAARCSAPAPTRISRRPDGKKPRGIARATSPARRTNSRGPSARRSACRKMTSKRRRARSAAKWWTSRVGRGRSPARHPRPMRRRHLPLHPCGASRASSVWTSDRCRALVRPAGSPSMTCRDSYAQPCPAEAFRRGREPARVVRPLSRCRILPSGATSSASRSATCAARQPNTSGTRGTSSRR